MTAHWPLRRYPPLVVDGVAALALTAAGQYEVWGAGHHTGLDARGHAAFGALTAVTTLAVAVRRRWPSVAVLVSAFSIAVTFLALTSDGPVSALFAILLTLYTAGTLLERKPMTITFVLAAAAAVVSGRDAGDWAFALVNFSAAVAAGRVTRRYRLLAGELADANEALRQERETNARLAVAEERTRIAREVHDVLAHTVSVMVVQAEVADELIGRDETRTRSAIHSIQSTGREALDEMRRLLGVLRDDTDGAPDHLPQPGLDRLSDLVTQFRNAGLDVRMISEGTPRHLPPGIELCAYRIVQEALTNTLKHSSAASATVRLSYANGGLEVEVVDAGTERADVPAAARGTGHGLLGLRERVAMYGGAIEAGARDGCGFAVRALLPYAVAVS